MSEENDYLAERDIGNGRKGWVIPLTFGRGRIIIGPANSVLLDDSW
jgi:hypothetical protein